MKLYALITALVAVFSLAGIHANAIPISLREGSTCKLFLKYQLQGNATLYTSSTAEEAVAELAKDTVVRVRGLDVDTQRVKINTIPADDNDAGYFGWISDKYLDCAALLPAT